MFYFKSWEKKGFLWYNTSFVVGVVKTLTLSVKCNTLPKLLFPFKFVKLKKAFLRFWLDKLRTAETGMD